MLHFKKLGIVWETLLVVSGMVVVGESITTYFDYSVSIHAHV